eukprot:295125-Pelagomonas_calceolata.AAC.2
MMLQRANAGALPQRHSCSRLAQGRVSRVAVRAATDDKLPKWWVWFVGMGTYECACIELDEDISPINSFSNGRWQRSTTHIGLIRMQCAMLLGSGTMLACIQHLHPNNNNTIQYNTTIQQLLRTAHRCFCGPSYSDRDAPVEDHASWALTDNEGFALVDVRPPDAYEEAHPAGSINVPMYQPIDWSKPSLGKAVTCIKHGVLIGLPDLQG